MAAPAPAATAEAQAAPGDESTSSAVADRGEPLASTFPDLNPSGPKEFDPQRVPTGARSRDAIRPIYDPVVVAATDAGLVPEDQVIGVSLGGESRAYPIRTLHVHEMANDELGGVPILVTW